MPGQVLFLNLSLLVVQHGSIFDIVIFSYELSPLLNSRARVIGTSNNYMCDSTFIEHLLCASTLGSLLSKTSMLVK